MWQPLAAHLRGMELITFDAPGCGRSVAAPVPLTMGVLARIVRGLLDRLDYDVVDVLGYSFGGAVAQQLARIAPERVRRLVLVGTACGWGWIPPSLPVGMTMATPLRYYSRRFYASTAPMLAGGQARDRRFVERAAEARFAHPPSVWGYMSQLASAASFTSLPWLHRLPHAALVVVGEDDRVVPPANSVLLASRLGRGRLVTLPDEGHYLLLDPHSAGGPLIADFLRADRLRASATWRDARRVGADDVIVAAATHVVRGPISLVNTPIRRAFRRLPDRGLHTVTAACASRRTGLHSETGTLLK
jgi:pimeloyl-ACP methyl ester carboxylesterase